MQNISLGQRVFLAGINTFVSDFNFCLKHPFNQKNNCHRSAPSLRPLIPAHLPFQAGFHPDLSFITNDDRLTDIISPPGFPAFIGWASHQEILCGSPVFTCRHNLMMGCWRTLAGRGINNAQRAIVEGTELTWNKGAYAENMAILWRSEPDHDTAQAFSGSVLCSAPVYHPIHRPEQLLFRTMKQPSKPSVPSTTIRLV